MYDRDLEVYMNSDYYCDNYSEYAEEIEKLMYEPSEEEELYSYGYTIAFA